VLQKVLQISLQIPTNTNVIVTNVFVS
jgi:hypothetical protein